MGFFHTFADSKEVQTWMKELDGFDIPDIAPTKDGTCAGDPVAAAAAAEKGWWTCGGYTRGTGMYSTFSAKNVSEYDTFLFQDIVDCPDKLTWGLR